MSPDYGEQSLGHEVPAGDGRASAEAVAPKLKPTHWSPR